MTASAGSYQLGIDLGTTYTAAATAREGQVEIAGLGNRAAAIPSVIYLAADGTVLTGETADRRGPSEPDRVAREFKRRLGDPTPLLLGGTPRSAEALTAELLRAVVAKVAELEGGPAEHLAITHPANWGPYKQDLLVQAIRMAGVSATTLTEPEAAAIAYAANERVEQGSLVAVYDLGGGTFDAAVLRKTAEGFAILGQPEGIERLGGIDFDEAVVGHVRTALGDALERADLDDPAVMAALTRLRRECIDAKEALSSDTDTTIPVLLPGVQTEVRLTRGEFEQMVRPTLAATVDALRRALASAAVEPDQITSVLLVGGSSRIPLVAELVSDAFGRPVAVDAHPKHAIALGAAHAAALQAGADEHGGWMPAAGAGVAAAGVTATDTGSGTRIMDDPEPTVVADDVPAAVFAGGHASEPGRDGRSAAADDRGRSFEGKSDDDPPWLPSAGSGGGGRGSSRRRLWVGIAAVLLLGALAVAANALVAPDQRRTTTTPEQELDGQLTNDRQTPPAAADQQAPAQQNAPAAGNDNGGGANADTGGHVDPPVTADDPPPETATEEWPNPDTEGDSTGEAPVDGDQTGEEVPGEEEVPVQPAGGENPSTDGALGEQPDNVTQAPSADPGEDGSVVMPTIGGGATIAPSM